MLWFPAGSVRLRTEEGATCTSTCTSRASYFLSSPLFSRSLLPGKLAELHTQKLCPQFWRIRDRESLLYLHGSCSRPAPAARRHGGLNLGTTDLLPPQEEPGGAGPPLELEVVGLLVLLVVLVGVTGTERGKESS